MMGSLFMERTKNGYSWRVLQPHFEASVRMRLTLPKVGTWSPPGLPRPYNSIAEVKTPRLEVFFIPLESS
jgi:hypothetical protein